jgi:dipeptidyl aminopeptidase/acylaminoacyl peptidase
VKRRAILLIAGVAVALGLGMCWQFGSMAVAPHASPGPTRRAGMDTVRLQANDGVSIVGSYWPGPRPKAPAVLLLHGNGASRAAMSGMGEWLRSLGYAVLAIDFRGRGESDQIPGSFGVFEARDAHAAYRWLAARQGHAPIGVVGISMGGAAALIGEAGPLPARCLVLQAVYPDIRRAIGNRIDATGGRALGTMVEPMLSFQSLPRFGVWPSRISPIRALPRYRGSVMIIGGGADRFTPPEETRALFDAAHGPKEYWIVDGLDHEAMSSDESEAYRDHIGAYLKRCLGQG